VYTLHESVQCVDKKNKPNDASLREERFSAFVDFNFEKEHSHKYVDPNIENILRPKFLSFG